MPCCESWDRGRGQHAFECANFGGREANTLGFGEWMSHIGRCDQYVIVAGPGCGNAVWGWQELETLVFGVADRGDEGRWFARSDLRVIIERPRNTTMT